MSTMLINAVQPEELRVALVNDNKILYDYITERPGFEEKIGNIYLGEITSIEPSLDATFINYGSKRHGFLPLKEIAREYFNTDDPEKLERPNIKELLKEGQKILIQVEKEERGNKGAALTTFISLAGSYLVLMANDPRAGGISRKIEGVNRDELRETLSKLEIPAGMGLIIRTAGVGRSLEELQWDLNVLLNYWEAIKKASQSHNAPLLIHQESDVVIRAIRDYLRADIRNIIIDHQETYEKAKHYLEQARPDDVSRLELYSENTPLFIRYDIEHQIEQAYQRTVRLKSGGSIVIDATEALVSIDINSARATRGSDIGETAFNTNLEAADEIARQLRLRDIGGLIVIDFIDMKPVRHQREVENQLRNALRLDRARVQIGRISQFGLLEMSRQRLRPSLQEAIQEICRGCNGLGSVRSVESLALSIIRMIEEDSIKENTGQIQVQLSNEAATYLLNEKRSIISEIEQRQRISIVIIPNPNMQYPNYQIKRLRKTEIIEQGSKIQTSYRLLETAEVEAPVKKPTSQKVAHEPVVKNLMPTLPPSPGPKKPAQGLIKRLWASMFSITTPKEKERDDSGTATTNGLSNYPTKHRSRKSHHKSRQRSAHRPSPGQQTNVRPIDDDQQPIKAAQEPSKPQLESTPPKQSCSSVATNETPGKDKSELPEGQQQVRVRRENNRNYSNEQRHSHRRRDERSPHNQRAQPKKEEPPTPSIKIDRPEPKAPKPIIMESPEAENQAPIVIRPTMPKEPKTAEPDTAYKDKDPVKQETEN